MESTVTHENRNSHSPVGYENPAFDSTGDDVSRPAAEEYQEIELEVVAVPTHARERSANEIRRFESSTDHSFHEGSFNNVIENKPAVVVVRNACKAYNPAVPILKNFSMTVDEGTIYTLLGSSGCGKTTMLSAIVGLHGLDKGTIYVFGKPPGDPESGVPGKNIGYMPQDLALFDGFSIRETLWYYGSLYCMPRDTLTKNMKWLVEFLALPSSKAIVGTLAGGQKRRVSMAVCMIHDPPLLILDEPTVGVDPILRESIWAHLVERVQQRNQTIIITTHYIEEARNSNRVGLMRNGKILAEKPPDVLMREHNAKMLEEVVIKLCKVDSEIADESALGSGVSSGSQLPKMARVKNAGNNDRFRDAMGRIAALAFKNALILLRNWMLLIFIIWVPAGQIIFAGLCLGGDPEDIKFAVVNHELDATGASNCDHLEKLQSHSNNSCNLEDLGCKFLTYVPSDQIEIEFYSTEDEAYEATKDGDVWGYVSIPSNFSQAYFAELTYQATSGYDNFKNATLTFRMDETIKIVTSGVQAAFKIAHKNFTEALLRNCSIWVGLADIGLSLEEEPPIYGDEDTDATHFLSPGLMTCILYFFPIMTSSIQYIYERKIGALERAKVAGINTWENMLAYSLVTFVTLIIQSVLALFIMAVIFDVDIEGSLALCMMINLLCGFMGVSLGFLFTTFLTQEAEATLFSVAVFMPLFTLTGVVVPIEGLPKFFAQIACKYFMVGTLAGESMRSIVKRGWGLGNSHVWPGFVHTFGVIVLCWVVTTFLYKKNLVR